MDKYLIEDFQNELTHINFYIKHIQQVNSLVDIEIPDNDIIQEFKRNFILFRNDKKLFEYKAIIISLYGLLQKHTEIWIQEYLRGLSRLVSYDKVAENIRNEHIINSLKLINFVIEGKQAKYIGLKKDTILKNLTICFENPSSYEFNENAFTIQTGNLSHKRIEEIFKSININISKELIKNNELIALTGLSSYNIKNTESNVLFGKINELVERRNSIAHGAIIDNFLDLDALEPYISFLEKYCIAIFSILEEKYIENHTIEKYKEVPCVGVFKNKTVIVINIENYKIELGDWLILKTAEQGNERFYKMKIRSLQKENIEYPFLKIVEKTKIGIGIDNNMALPISIKCLFYLEIK